MRSLWLLFLVGLATGFISEKLFVSSQSPFSIPDDLYLEGQSSGLPIDDEDVDDESSASGSGDYAFPDISDAEDLLNVFLNFTKTIFSDKAPVLPQSTADPTHNPPTTSDSQDQTTPNIFPTEDNRAEVPTADWFMTSNNPGSTSMPPSETTATEFGIDISVTEDTDTSDVSTIKEIEEELSIIKDSNNGVMSSGGSRRFGNAPEQVTSENTWEKTEVLAAVIACGVIGFLCAVVLLILLAYRLKKKDEGSYDLGDTKLSTTAYQKAPTKEFYA